MDQELLNKQQQKILQYSVYGKHRSHYLCKWITLGNTHGCMAMKLILKITPARPSWSVLLSCPRVTAHGRRTERGFA